MSLLPFEVYLPSHFLIQHFPFPLGPGTTTSIVFFSLSLSVACIFHSVSLLAQILLPVTCSSLLNLRKPFFKPTTHWKYHLILLLPFPGLPLFALQHPRFMLPLLTARSHWTWPVSGIDTVGTLFCLKLPALLVPGKCSSLCISPTFLAIPCQPFMSVRKGWWSVGLSSDCLLSSHCSSSHCSPRVQSHRISSQLPVHVAISCYSLNISTGVSRLPRFIFSEVRLLLLLLHIYFSPGHSYLGIDISVEAVTRDNTCTRCVLHMTVTK